MCPNQGTLISSAIVGSLWICTNIRYFASCRCSKYLGIMSLSGLWTCDYRESLGVFWKYTSLLSLVSPLLKRLIIYIFFVIWWRRHAMKADICHGGRVKAVKTEFLSWEANVCHKRRIYIEEGDFWVESFVQFKVNMCHGKRFLYRRR